MHMEDDKLTVLIDIPGFRKEDIKLTLNRNILSIQAYKEKIPDEKKHNMVCNQRPNMIDKKIRLPIGLKEGEEKVTSAKYDQGVFNDCYSNSKTWKGHFNRIKIKKIRLPFSKYCKYTHNKKRTNHSNYSY